MKLFRLATLVFAVLCVAFAGQASAAEDGMQAFREAYLPSAKNSQVYHVDIMFNSPNVQSNVTASTQSKSGGQFVLDGKLNWAYTDRSTNQTVQTDTPIYVEREGDAFTVYGNRNGTWMQETLFNGTAWILDAFSTDNNALKEQYAASVKSVKLLDRQGSQQRMQIIFDGKKLSQVEDSFAKSQAAGANGKPDQEFERYLKAALAENDLECTWAVNTETGTTITVAANLTNIMRSYAKAVLQDSYESKIQLTPEETEILSSIGYYCNLQFYLSPSKNVRSLSIPPEVKSTAKSHDFLEELGNEVAAAAGK